MLKVGKLNLEMTIELLLLFTVEFGSPNVHVRSLVGIYSLYQSLFIVVYLYRPGSRVVRDRSICVRQLRA